MTRGEAAKIISDTAEYLDETVVVRRAMVSQTVWLATQEFRKALALAVEALEEEQQTTTTSGLDFLHDQEEAK